MRLTSDRRSEPVTMDMTPMIDVSFQLIIFFMLTLNFASAEQDELIRLPASELAKPQETRLQSPLTLQITSAGQVVVGGDLIEVASLRNALEREKKVIQALPGRDVRLATVILRADRDVPGGIVRRVIKICEDEGFENFVLRAQEGRRPMNKDQETNRS